MYMPKKTALALCVAVSCSAYLSILYGQDLPKPADSSVRYQQTVLPILAKNCFACHSDRIHTAGLSLEALQDPSLALQKPEVWTKVLDKLKAGTMPPRTMPPLSATDGAAITGWIERMHGGPAPATADSTTVDPGRVTARRLNRTEYNNTIRDLLGVTLRPADEFPTDDSGYGFDNIGDVLSVSPLLMEKYLSAARSVSKVAVFGETYPLKPTLLVRLLPKKIQDDEQATGNVTPFSARGSLYATYRAPVDAEYEFRFRYQNFRGGEPVITTDGPGRGARGARNAGGAGGATDAPAVAGGPGPAAEPGAASSQGRGAGRGRGAFVPRPVTDEERKARYERARTAAPPEPLVFTIDGKEVFSYVVQGTTDYEYSRGESVVRVKLAAGDHALRVIPGPGEHRRPADAVQRRRAAEALHGIHGRAGPIQPVHRASGRLQEDFCLRPRKHRGATQTRARKKSSKHLSRARIDARRRRRKWEDC